MTKRSDKTILRSDEMPGRAQGLDGTDFESDRIQRLDGNRLGFFSRYGEKED